MLLRHGSGSLTVGVFAALMAAVGACSSDSGSRERAASIEVKTGTNSCRIKEGLAECRGDNRWGLVRNPASEERIDAWTGSALPELSTEIAIGALSDYACVVGRSGLVRCWGRRQAMAQPVPGVVDARKLALGGGLGCALTEIGEVLCWRFSMASDADYRVDEPAGKVPIGRATAIAAELVQTCAVVREGAVCWGGRLPDDAGVQRMALGPTPVPGTEGATSLRAEIGRICAQRRTGTETCWSTTPMPLQAPP